MEEQNNRNVQNQKPEENNHETGLNSKKAIPKMTIIIGALVVVVVAIAVVLAILLGGKDAGGNNNDDDNNDTPTHTHSFGEWETTKAATCTAEGSKERYCSCGEKQTQSISAIGHQYGEWTTATVATCTENGEQERVCICGEKETKIIDKLAHTEVEAEGKAPTATTAGYGNGTICEVCQTTLKEHETLYSIRDYVLKNPTTAGNGEYKLFVNASDLIPSINGVLQISCSNSSTDVTVSLSTFPNSATAYTTQITLNNVKTTLLTYGYMYQITIGNAKYFDGIKGEFNPSKLYDLNELTYNDSASTIGGPQDYQTERFDSYKEPACEMTQNLVSLLNTFLTKADFGYTVEVYGFKLIEN